MDWSVENFWLFTDIDYEYWNPSLLVLKGGGEENQNLPFYCSNEQLVSKYPASRYLAILTYKVQINLARIPSW